jgi:hypothetical protein
VVVGNEFRTPQSKRGFSTARRGARFLGEKGGAEEKAASLRPE